MSVEADCHQYRPLMLISDLRYLQSSSGFDAVIIASVRRGLVKLQEESGVYKKSCDEIQQELVHVGFWICPIDLYMFH